MSPTITHAAGGFGEVAQETHLAQGLPPINSPGRLCYQSAPHGSSEWSESLGLFCLPFAHLVLPTIATEPQRGLRGGTMGLNLITTAKESDSAH